MTNEQIALDFAKSTAASLKPGGVWASYIPSYMNRQERKAIIKAYKKVFSKVEVAACNSAEASHTVMAYK